MTPYRTLVFAHLVQEGALTVGGNAPHILVDLPLARDGKGRPVLRGSSIAGSFIATARAIARHLPAAITCDPEARDLIPSAWRFAHAHPLDVRPVSAFFQHVSIDPRTQAAKDDHIFNLEALPTGTRWNFVLEIVAAPDTDFGALEALAAATLAEWSKPGGARLGRGSRHGYGWCHLENIAIARLDTRHTMLWPDALAPERRPEEWVEYLRKQSAPVLDLGEFMALHPWVDTQSRYVADLTGSIQVGERDDEFGAGYGLDTLSVGGHARMQMQARDFFSRVIRPCDIPFSEEDFDPDFAITAMPDECGRLVPYVPGASIRGVWRAALTRNDSARHLLETLFGSTKRAGRLSVADATLADDGWKLLWQQHVAIDEFSGGTYEAAKFDRLCIAHARLSFRARIEAATEAEALDLAKPIQMMLDTLGDGALPLGGGIYRGHGHVRWRLADCRVRQLAASVRGEGA